jgi:hypothetical protein
MFALMHRVHSVSRTDALAPASVVVDLRVTQMVDQVVGIRAVLPNVDEQELLLDADRQRGRINGGGGTRRERVQVGRTRGGHGPGPFPAPARKQQPC